MPRISIQVELFNVGVRIYDIDLGNSSLAEAQMELERNQGMVLSIIGLLEWFSNNVFSTATFPTGS